jgi:hypothetical protein
MTHPISRGSSGPPQEQADSQGKPAAILDTCRVACRDRWPTPVFAAPILRLRCENRLHLVGRGLLAPPKNVNSRWTAPTNLTPNIPTLALVPDMRCALDGWLVLDSRVGAIASSPAREQNRPTRIDECGVSPATGIQSYPLLLRASTPRTALACTCDRADTRRQWPRLRRRRTPGARRTLSAAR